MKVYIELRLQIKHNEQDPAEVKHIGSTFGEKRGYAKERLTSTSEIRCFASAGLYLSHIAA